MKAIVWTDNEGRKRRSLVKDSDGLDQAPYGLPFEPPDIAHGLDWEAIKQEIQQVLFDMGLNTWQDVQREQYGITAATNVLKRHLVNFYKSESSKI